MIQEQSPLQQQHIHGVYEEVEFINTCDQAVCITGPDELNYTYSSMIPIVIQNSKQQQSKEAIKNLSPKKKIILITSPNTTVLTASNLNQDSLAQNPRWPYQAIKTIPRAGIIPRTTTSTTRVISAPFLPNVPSTTPIVKQNSPIKFTSVKTAHPETRSNINHLKNNLKEIGSLNSFLSPYKSKSQTQVQNQFSKIEKPTLATMAGIQLTGSMESLPAAMSGAMQNATATVEEINVPVFIDEYLQQTTFPTTNSFNNDNNNSSTFAAKTYNGNGNKAFNIDDECDIFENFGFDLNLNSTGEYEVSSSSFSATKKSTAASSNISAHQQQDNMNNMSNINENIGDDYDDVLDTILDGTTGPRNECEDYIQEQYKFLPQTNSEDFLPTEDFYGDINIMDVKEYAVDITAASDDVELQELMNSQNNPMFSSSCITFSQSSITDDLSRAIAKAEPEVLELTSDSYFPIDAIKKEQSGISVESNNDDEAVGGVSFACSSSGATKRTRRYSQSQRESMSEKRRRLHLDTSNTNTNSYSNIPTTPVVIELIEQMSADNQHDIMNFRNNAQDILTDLQNVTNSSFLSHTSNDEFEEDTSPSTPLSCYSSNNSTIYKNTISSPNSPALSTISNITRTIEITKSKRGRPPKPHSDKPDPSLLLNCSESERKRLEDRAKNNEASRLSRLKNKQREDEEIEIEQRLQLEIDELNYKYDHLLKDEKKLKRALEAFCVKRRA